MQVRQAVLADDDSCGGSLSGITVVPNLASTLQLYGGLPGLFIPADTSPAICAAPACVDWNGAPVTVDQNGLERPQPPGTHCDVGAFESMASRSTSPSPPSVVVTVTPCVSQCQPPSGGGSNGNTSSGGNGNTGGGGSHGNPPPPPPPPPSSPPFVVIPVLPCLNVLPCPPPSGGGNSNAGGGGSSGSTGSGGSTGAAPPGNTSPPSVSVPQPDLVVSALDAHPRAARGGPLRATITVANQGTASAPASTVALLFVPGPTPSPSALLLGTCSVGPLAPGQQASCQVTVRALPRTPQQQGYLVAVVDLENSVVEVNDINNSLAQPFLIQ